MKKMKNEENMQFILDTFHLNKIPQIKSNYYLSESFQVKNK